MSEIVMQARINQRCRKNFTCRFEPADAREKLEDWRRHYNKDRPHSAIGYKVLSDKVEPVSTWAR
ncbi:integrase core domain-containing protein [Actibacterium sp.]|uniref:integrase core domain-containing protein n=1 Tax=Actibacterium sp. TaxID=1872125 RepID=UPI00356866DF